MFISGTNLIQFSSKTGMKPYYIYAKKRVGTVSYQFNEHMPINPNI